MKSRKSILKPRWRKVFSDLWGNKLRTLLVVASIAVGVFSVGTIAGAYVIISEDMNIGYAAANPANIEIRTDPFFDDFVRSVERIPGVKDAEGRHILGVRVSQGGDSWSSFDLVAIKNLGESKIFLRAPIEGDLLPDRREMIVEEKLLEDLDVHAGDVLQIQLPDGTIRELPVAGIVQDQDSILTDFGASPKGYIALDTMEWLGQATYYNRLYATVSGNPDDETYIEQVSEDIKDKFEKSDLQTYSTDLSKTNEHPMASTVRAVLGVLGALGVLITVLSSSLIANTLNALLNQHLRQIGVMKLIGARSFQILVMYLLLILSFGLIALSVSVPAAGVAAYALSEFIAGKIGFILQGYRIVPAASLLQVLIAILVPLAAGFIPVKNGSKIKVRRAISEVRPGEQSAPGLWLDRLGGWVQWLTRPVLLSIRNTFRRKGRLALTLFTLTMGGAIFIAVFNVRASMGAFLDNLGRHFIADVSVSFERPYRISAVEQAVFQVPGVRDIEGWATAGADILNPDDSLVDNMRILAPPADSSLLNADMVTGRWIYPEEKKALVVSDSIWAIYPDLQPGDTLRLEVGGQRADDWVVVGIFRFTNQLRSVLGYANYDYISQQLNMTDQAFSYRVVTGEHSLEYQKRISAQIDQHLRELGFQVNDVEAGLATLSQASESINVLIVFLLVMALLTALVGSIGLTGTMGMNVLERTREIGVMRAIGAVDLEIIKSVIIEGSSIGIISWVFGGVISIPISSLLLNFLSIAFSAPILLTFTVDGYVIWLLVVLALSVLSSVLPAHSAARLTIREVLAYE